MRVLHVTNSLAAAEGGVVEAVRGWTAAQARLGLEITLLAPVTAQESSLIRPEGVIVETFPASWLARWWNGYAPKLKDAASRAVAGVDLVHLHNLWHYPQFATYLACRRQGIPYVVTPHGTLKPAALRYKALRKRVFMTLFQRWVLRHAAALHAITNEEADHFRRFSPNVPIVVLPNGVDVNAFQDLPPRPVLDQRFPTLQGHRVILFLGRLHSIKRLDVLCRAFVRLASERGDVRLLVAGHDSTGYSETLRKILASDDALDKVVFAGFLEGELKLAALGGADLFVLPSQTEVRGLAALEAMVCGLPVVISEQCDFPEAVHARAALAVDMTPESLTATLIDLLDDPQRRREMGDRARRFVEKGFDWTPLAKQMASLYERVVAESRAPK